MNEQRWVFVRKLAKELEKTTPFSVESTEVIGRQFDYLSEAELSQLLPLIQDIASVYGVDLVTAADKVIKSISMKGLAETVLMYCEELSHMSRGP